MFRFLINAVYLVKGLIEGGTNSDNGVALIDAQCLLKAIQHQIEMAVLHLWHFREIPI